MADVHWTDGRRAPERSRPTQAEIIPFNRAELARSETSPLLLAQLIEGEIIPRLLLAHQPSPLSSSNVVSLVPISGTEVVVFSELALVQEVGPLLAHVEGLMERGLAVEDVYLNLLSPAARWLGELWEQDLCSFTDVTVGLCRLQQVVYEISSRSTVSEPPAERGSALFALTPGDQHGFGLVLVTEFFRRAGWRTESAPDATAAELIERVSTQAYDLVGFSMADEQWLASLPQLIADLRDASRNPKLRIIVGGRVFSERPERVALVGADATAEDPREAVKRAEALAGSRSAVA